MPGTVIIILPRRLSGGAEISLELQDKIDGS
jgi:hypothetical protein